MKTTFLVMLSIYFVSSRALAGNTVALQCHSNGNNLFALLLDGEGHNLNVAMFNQITYGGYPQVRSNQSEILFFSKKPTNSSNGIPMQFEVPLGVLKDLPHKVKYTVKVNVSQNWPGPIREDVFYTHYLECIKVRGFLY